MEIPPPHRDQSGARHQNFRAPAPPAEDTTLPARWSHRFYAPSIQVSCRQKIAERKYYNCISRNEIDKILVLQGSLDLDNAKARTSSAGPVSEGARSVHVPEKKKTVSHRTPKNILGEKC